MELKINLDETKQSKPRFVFGIFVLLFSVGAIVYGISVSNWFMITFSLFLAVISLGNIYEGNGKSMSTLFGKRFISIDEEKISLKPNTIESAKTVNWQEIESVKVGANKIEILNKAKSNTLIEYSNLSYKSVQEIKAVIQEIAGKKNVLQK